MMETDKLPSGKSGATHFIFKDYIQGVNYQIT